MHFLSDLGEDLARWRELAALYRLTLGPRQVKELQQAFRQSAIRCFVFDDNGQLIGAGRAISDGVYYTIIFDVVVYPTYQKMGIGTQIMQYLLERNQAKYVWLQAVPGKEAFYEKLGFARLKTAMGLYPHPEVQRKQGYIE
ncbi:GNAT family N-acetyltransferase [Thermoflavimicrobium dichotomicum]|uniref:Predicted N-acetyltransferase YhbS n=1 Tax=Thermoflavimicrobium dichotomicum TaxID=46223 RepID=A0A1I3NG89_9BACL|nr:GNAT family N-acetyltransferase [Thermoflavimicrobium dichotomicum]SFJ08311.1 Predicted N-acetyltransferase YhbS [Thermoflavimicrobium dichotomicum]